MSEPLPADIEGPPPIGKPYRNVRVHLLDDVHGICERANSLLKTTFKALRDRRSSPRPAPARARPHHLNDHTTP